MKIGIYCEYLKNPSGIDCERPRFSWEGKGLADGVEQKAYQVIVSKEKDGLVNSQAVVVWDSGVVVTDQSTNISYGGEKLETAHKYFYQVVVIDEHDIEHQSDVGVFTTGIMEPNTWRATWLGSALMNQHAFWFRTSLQLDRQNIEAAYAYVISPNYYSMTINGNKTTDTVLNNAWTDCNKTILYKTYDIIDFLQQGENVVGIELANGWNALEMGIADDGLGEHQFSVQIFLRYIDGKTKWILSDPNEWKYTTNGPLVYNNIYHGETWDFTKEIVGWDKPGYESVSSEVKWLDAVEFEPLQGTIRAEMLEPIRVVETKAVEQMNVLQDGSFAYDMGQNFAGWAKISVREMKGTEVRLSYAEIENEDHSLNKMTLRGVRATDTFICKGDGTETFEPSYTYHGFRYVQVSGLTQKPESIVGCVVRSSVEHIGMFESDNNIINQLQSNITWTEASNLHGVPTDCPQRDERLGWLNDMTVRNECAIYNYRLPQLYAKWLQDIRDAQGVITGAITDTAPFVRFGSRPADPVSSSFLLIPWNIYCHYGDKKIISDNYEPMKRWVAYLIRNSNEYIVKYSHMGDWASPIGGTDHNSVGGGAVSTITPTQLMATGYLYYDCILMTKMAKVLGMHEDATYFDDLAERVKRAFQEAYYHKEGKYYAANSQASNTFPLYLDIVPEQDKEQILKNLTDDIKRRDIHLTTGNLCSRYIIEVLFRNGEEDLAYELLTQTSYPSWGYMIENGATTIWERWEKIVEENTFLSHMASYNHPMNGAVGVSFYKYIAGINIDEDRVAFANVIIKPIMPQKLSSAKASVKTIRGTVSSKWSKNKKFHVELKITIPFNCTAIVYLPIKHLNKDRVEMIVNDVVVGEGNMKYGNIQYNGMDHNFAKFKVQSGEYCFSARD